MISAIDRASNDISILKEAEDESGENNRPNEQRIKIGRQP